MPPDTFQANDLDKVKLPSTLNHTQVSLLIQTKHNNMDNLQEKQENKTDEEAFRREDEMFGRKHR